MPLMLTFGNLAGFWFLLGIPLILFIHFLQREAKTVTVSTLFLLDNLEKQSLEGRRIEKLRNSIPLWLQLLLVLLLTWLMIQPLWLKQNSVQKVVLVIDESASMRAFQDRAFETLREILPKIRLPVTTMEIIALSSHLQAKPLYNGTSVSELIDQLRTRTPFRSAHDPSPALRVGRSLAGSAGTLLFLTDHRLENPGYGAEVVAIGENFGNVGFAGISIDSADSSRTWKALVRNYGKSAQSREWFMQAGQNKTATRTLELGPGETRTLQGRFPEATQQITLHLSADLFELDNQAPIVLPRAREISIARIVSPNLEQTVSRLIESIESRVSPSDAADTDLTLCSYNPIDPKQPPPVAVVFVDQPQVGGMVLNGPIVASSHPLIKGLNWQGLIARAGPGIPLIADQDEVLLWQGEKPLIFLRTGNATNQLIFNFNLSASNAEALPAFIIINHRFIESIRERKTSLETKNFELNQAIDSIASANTEGAEFKLITSTGSTVEINPAEISTLRAPNEPCFFEVKNGEQTLVEAAAHFADTREADFSSSITEYSIADLKPESVLEYSRKDSYWQIWALLAVLLALLAWHFSAARTEKTAVTASR